MLQGQKFRRRKKIKHEFPNGNRYAQEHTYQTNHIINSSDVYVQAYTITVLITQWSEKGFFPIKYSLIFPPKFINFVSQPAEQYGVIHMCTILFDPSMCGTHITQTHTQQSADKM